MFTTVLCVLAASVLVVAEDFCPHQKRIKTEDCITPNLEGYTKCGVFFHNLYTTSGPELTWIGAIPDSISARDETDPEVQEFLGNVELKAFKGSIGKETANEKCYAMMLQLNKQSLKSCKKTVFKRGDEKVNVGQKLCNQATRFLNKRGKDPTALKNAIRNGGIENLDIVFYYSTEGEQWKPVTENGQGPAYKIEGSLCCAFNQESNGSKSTYYPCGEEKPGKKDDPTTINAC